MAPKHQAPRGTRDLLPGETERWQWVEDRTRAVLGRYGYREIRTPIFEDFELFARTSGESSDVVQKEMYRFKDLKGRDLALRPENTAGVCRAYLEHNLQSQGRIHRLWYTGPMFRYGRPQKGRFRQFWQVGAEIIGTQAPGADVEMIALFVDLFEAWGIGNLTVLLNSVGTPATRRAYGEALRHWFEPVQEWLSAESKQRLVSNPLRILDSKDPVDLAIVAVGAGVGPILTGEVSDADRNKFEAALGRLHQSKMPRLLDELEPADRAHFDAVVQGLDALGIAHELDHGLVRGLDYYTRTAFEVHDRSLGAQSALGGGGRYDGLIEELGGPATPGVGFSIGLDRTLLVLGERGLAAPAEEGRIYLVGMDATRSVTATLARALRNEFTVDIDLESRGVPAQLKSADRSGAALAVIVGEDEWNRGEVLVKDLKTGAQETVARDRLPETLRARLRTTGQVQPS